MIVEELVFFTRTDLEKCSIISLVHQLTSLKLKTYPWWGCFLKALCHESGCPSNTLTLAPHYYCTSPTDYISHNPLHWCQTADRTNHTADCPGHSLHWLHWSHTLYKPWTSSLSLPSIVLPLSRSLRGSLWGGLSEGVSLRGSLWGGLSEGSLLLTTWTVYSHLTVCCLPLWPCLPFGFSLCLPPAPTFALSLPMYQPCLRYSSYCWLNFACMTSSCLIKLHLDLNVPDPSHYTHIVCLYKTLIEELEWCGSLLSAVWTLVLTAPIHCKGSIGEQVQDSRYK